MRTTTSSSSNATSSIIVFYAINRYSLPTRSFLLQLAPTLIPQLLQADAVFAWGSGSQGQLGHGPVKRSGARYVYEELLPRRLDAFDGTGTTQLEFGSTHSAACTFIHCLVDCEKIRLTRLSV